KAGIDLVPGQHIAQVVVLSPNTVNTVLTGERPLFFAGLVGERHRRATAQPAAEEIRISVQQAHGEAAFSQVQGRHQASQPAADNDDPVTHTAMLSPLYVRYTSDWLF